VRYLLAVALLVWSASSFGGWHTGKVEYIGVGYDGVTITVNITGWSRSDCTCYPTWPAHMCMDSSRQTHAFEKAMLLAVRARDAVVAINIEETTCRIIALYENDS